MNARHEHDRQLAIKAREYFDKIEDDKKNYQEISDDFNNWRTKLGRRDSVRRFNLIDPGDREYGDDYNWDT